jgi:hypothetical protein
MKRIVIYAEIVKSRAMGKQTLVGLKASLDDKTRAAYWPPERFCLGIGGVRFSSVHYWRNFKDRALAPEVLTPVTSAARAVVVCSCDERLNACSSHRLVYRRSLIVLSRSLPNSLTRHIHHHLADPHVLEAVVHADHNGVLAWRVACARSAVFRTSFCRGIPFITR